MCDMWYHPKAVASECLSLLWCHREAMALWCCAHPLPPRSNPLTTVSGECWRALCRRGVTHYDNTDNT